MVFFYHNNTATLTLNTNIFLYNHQNFTHDSLNIVRLITSPVVHGPVHYAILFWPDYVRLLFNHWLSRGNETTWKPLKVKARVSILILGTRKNGNGHPKMVPHAMKVDRKIRRSISSENQWQRLFAFDHHVKCAVGVFEAIKSPCDSYLLPFPFCHYLAYRNVKHLEASRDACSQS